MNKTGLKRLERKTGMSWALKAWIMRRNGWRQGKGHHWVKTRRSPIRRRRKS